jgi:plasmid stabilization system protein ParE
VSLHYDGRLFYTTREYQSRDYTSLTEGLIRKDGREAKALIKSLRSGVQRLESGVKMGSAFCDKLHYDRLHSVLLVIRQQ